MNDHVYKQTCTLQTRTDMMELVDAVGGYEGTNWQFLLQYVPVIRRLEYEGCDHFLSIYTPEELADRASKTRGIGALGVDLDTRDIPDEELLRIPTVLYFKKYIEDVLTRTIANKDYLSFRNLVRNVEKQDDLPRPMDLLEYKWVVFALGLTMALFDNVPNKYPGFDKERVLEIIDFFMKMLQKYSEHAMSMVIAFDLPELLHIALKYKMYPAYPRGKYEGLLQNGRDKFIVPMFSYLDKYHTECGPYISHLWMCASKSSKANTMREFNKVVPMTRHMNDIQWPNLVFGTIQDCCDSRRVDKFKVLLELMEQAIQEQEWSMDEKAAFWDTQVLFHAMHEYGFDCVLRFNAYKWQHMAYERFVKASSSEKPITKPRESMVVASSSAADRAAMAAIPKLDDKMTMMSPPTDACIDELLGSSKPRAIPVPNFRPSPPKYLTKADCDEELRLELDASAFETHVDNAIEWVEPFKAGKRFTVRRISFCTKKQNKTFGCLLGLYWKDVDGFVVVDKISPKSVFGDFLKEGDVFLSLESDAKGLQCISGLQQTIDASKLKDLYRDMCQYETMFSLVIATYDRSEDCRIEDVVDNAHDAFCVDRTSLLISQIMCEEGVVRTVAVSPTNGSASDVVWGMTNGKIFVRNVRQGCQLSRDLVKGDVLVEIRDDFRKHPLEISAEFETLSAFNATWKSLWTHGTLPFEMKTIRTMEKARKNRFQSLGLSIRSIPKTSKSAPVSVRQYSHCGDKYVQVMYEIGNKDIGVELDDDNCVTRVDATSPLFLTVKKGMCLETLDVLREFKGEPRSVIRDKGHMFDEELTHWWNEQSKFEGLTMKAVFEDVSTDDEDDKDSAEEMIVTSRVQTQEVVSVKFVSGKGNPGIRLNEEGVVTHVDETSCLRDQVQVGMTLCYLDILGEFGQDWHSFQETEDHTDPIENAKVWNTMESFKGYKFQARFARPLESLDV